MDIKVVGIDSGNTFVILENIVYRVKFREVTSKDKKPKKRKGFTLTSELLLVYGKQQLDPNEPNSIPLGLLKAMRRMAYAILKNRKRIARVRLARKLRERETSRTLAREGYFGTPDEPWNILIKPGQIVPPLHDGGSTPLEEE